MSQDFDVERYARLSRLTLKEEEIPELKRQMNNIMEMVEDLLDLDLENVEGTNFAVTIENVIRDDEAGKSVAVDEVVATFPDTEENQCRVPQIIEEKAEEE